MKYADIDKCEMCNGNDIGTTLFVQGCPYHCRNCFNPETWDFNGGKEWTEEVEQNFIKSIDKPYIKRVSFLGGEPLANENAAQVLRLISIIKRLYPDKKIWVYSGNIFENLRTTYDLSQIDYIVDGLYMDNLRDVTLAFRGSLNQRIIDVKKSLMTNRTELYKES
jgi:anaerobic ribonucleoside-triphosphate reductase activating protein